MTRSARRALPSSISAGRAAAAACGCGKGVGAQGVAGRRRQTHDLDDAVLVAHRDARAAIHHLGPVHDEVGASARRKVEPMARRSEGLVGGAAVEGHDQRLDAPECEAGDAGRHGVDKAQEEPLMGSEHDILDGLAVDRQPRGLVADRPIVDNQHQLAVDRIVVVRVDDEHAIKTRLRLPARLGRHVAMIPEGPGVGRHEADVGRPARCDRGRGQPGRAIDDIGDPDTMPMERGRTVEAIDETHIDRLPGLGPNQRAGNAAAEGRGRTSGPLSPPSLSSAGRASRIDGSAAAARGGEGHAAGSRAAAEPLHDPAARRSPG